LKELAEQERQRLESERIAANQFKKQQLEEAVRTQRELIQMEALADQQRQVQAAMEAEERKKAAMDAADKSAFTDEERLANATTMEQLREINQKIIADNLELKKQLAQLNFKLDKILARLDYQPDMEKVEIPASSTMRNLQGGKRLILRNIYFDYNLASLRSKSKYELNKLFNFMKGSPDVEIVVSGHTDSKGNDDYNFRLSKDRAQAVVDYLIRNGISSSRLSAQGYGETRPIARNENPDLTDNPVGRQLNRRIEISMAQGREKGVEVEQVEIPNEAQIK
jgi:outer membrane protein OmpA-like peptidoglycan-associated protein